MKAKKHECVCLPGVRTMTVAELNERLEETETNIRRFSEELVQQLALRDELDFEKEVKNSFISALIDVQNRQKEHRDMLKKKKKKHKGGAGTSHGNVEKTLGQVSSFFFWVTRLCVDVLKCEKSLKTFLFSTSAFLAASVV